MFVRTVDIAADGDPIKLQSAERLRPGWYLFRVAYNPADLTEWGGAQIFLATSGVSNRSVDMLSLGQAESQMLLIDEPCECLIQRTTDQKTRVIVTEV